MISVEDGIISRRCSNKKKMADMRHIIRVVNTDLDGKKQIAVALCRVKGVSRMFANALCQAAGIAPDKKAGALSEAEEGRLNDLIQKPGKAGIPSWLYNRRKDPESGEDSHLVGPDVRFTRDNDIKFQRKIKSYVGSRHASNLPVRGQRTQSNFRRQRKKQVSKKVRK